MFNNLRAHLQCVIRDYLRHREACGVEFNRGTSRASKEQIAEINAAIAMVNYIKVCINNIIVMRITCFIISELQYYLSD